MRKNHFISVIIPAINEEANIGRVIEEIPDWVDEVLVVDNGSTDNTVAIARSHGAKVIHEAERGYGAACLRGIAELNSQNDIVVFLDGDYSDYPGEMHLLVDPIIDRQADMVIGSRIANALPGALTPQARFGNWLSCRLMRWFWGVQYTDLGPFRAIRRESLISLNMKDRNYGWTVEMQIKAAQRGIRELEVPVRYRKRGGGKSKVSGNIRGIIGAGTKILAVIFRSALENPQKDKIPS
jgi:glycosyltransferase involved in cell wall biosynthesis